MIIVGKSLRLKENIENILKRTFPFVGEISVLYLTGENNLEVKILALPNEWCLARNSGALKALDVNGDSYTDVLCHNQTGEMKILLHRESTSLVHFHV